VPAASPGPLPGPVTIREISKENWRPAAAISVRDDQSRFVATVPYYLALCHYGGEWKPLALYEADLVAGFAMWARDTEDGSYWIGGFTIDRTHQGRGVGREAMRELIGFLSAKPDCREIALSYHPQNTPARRLYASLGFQETGEREGDEVVARLSLQ
jgi:diamine N-acetyltransferase